MPERGESPSLPARGREIARILFDSFIVVRQRRGVLRQ